MPADRNEIWPTFIASYGDGGERYQFEFQARDMADADRRLAAIKAWAKLDGQLMLTIKVPTGLVAWWRALKKTPRPGGSRGRGASGVRL